MFTPARKTSQFRSSSCDLLPCVESIRGFTVKFVLLLHQLFRICFFLVLDSLFPPSYNLVIVKQPNEVWIVHHNITRVAQRTITVWHWSFMKKALPINKMNYPSRNLVVFRIVWLFTTVFFGGLNFPVVSHDLHHVTQGGRS